MDDDTRSILANAPKVGYGATADVYRVEDPLGGTFAWKLCNGRPCAKQCLLDEAAQMKRIGAHPHVTTLHGTCDLDGEPILIMDYAAGGDLLTSVDATIKQRGWINPRTIKIIVWQLLQAVQHLHAAGLLHRDIKLENVLLRHECPEGRLDRLRDHDIHVVLADMGFVCAEQATRTIPWRGTLCATAPESLHAKECPSEASYSFASDVWSVGVIAYELIRCKRLFVRPAARDMIAEIKKFSTMHTVRERTLSFIPQDARDFVSRLLHPDPTLRMTVAEALDHPWLREANLAGLQQRREEPMGYAMVVGGGLQQNQAGQAALQDLPATPVSAVDLSDESEDDVDTMPRVAAPASKKVLPKTAWDNIVATLAELDA